jgi:DNA-binding transcriptional ArsR family regulator
MLMTEKNREGTFAAIFDALGHPTRLRVMKILRNQAVNFADLKRALKIESSGHLQYHLSKLENLIETNQQGMYTLSDDGKDAMLMIENVEKTSGPERKTYLAPRWKLLVRAMSTAAIVLLAAVVIAAFLGDLYYEQTVYRYDILQGNLYNPIDTAVCENPFNLQPNQTLGFANVVGPPSNFTTSWYEENETDTMTHVSLPESNQTFKRFSYAVFQLTLTSENLVSMETNRMYVRVNLSTDPDGSAWPEIIYYHSEAFPPYKTRLTEPASYGILPDMRLRTYRILPITGYGKYTYSLTNVGNTTATGTVSLWSTEITVATHYLDTELNTTISNPARIYPEAKTYAKPLTSESTLFIASTIFFSALIIYLINKGNKTARFGRTM